MTIFQTIKGIGEFAKKAALPVVVLVQAHPVVAACTVVVAVTVAVVAYNYYKNDDEKEGDYKYSSNSDETKRNSSGEAPQTIFQYDPMTKSVTDCGISVSNSPVNLRKRHVAQNASSTTDNHVEIEVRSDQQSNLIVHDDLSNENLGIMTVPEKINDFFRRNISETDSGRNSDESVQCYDNSEAHSTENSNDSNTLPSSSSSSSWSDVSIEIVTACNNAEETDVTTASSVCSIASIGSLTSVGTLLSGDSDWCRCCEENPVNAYIEPCNHRYMCADCATKIIRLFKRCKICRTRIERIVTDVL